MARATQPLKRSVAAVGRIPADPSRQKIEPLDAAKMLHLIRAAEAIFLAKGYHTATMNDVAKAAGMSKKTVYQLIESKAELFAALMEYHHEKLTMPVIEDGWTAQEILVQNLLALGRFLLAPEQISIIRLIMAEYTHSNDLGRAFHKKHVSNAKGFLENCLLRLVPPQHMKSTNAKEMAAMLFGMAIGEFHLSVLMGFRPVPSKAALTQRIRHTVDLFWPDTDVARSTS